MVLVAMDHVPVHILPKNDDFQFSSSLIPVVCFGQIDFYVTSCGGNFKNQKGSNKGKFSHFRSHTFQKANW